MIPGPIEFEPEVLQAMAIATTSHVAANFIETFGNSLDLMQTVWEAPNGQPFIVSGSGTLAMDMAVTNLIEKGDNALVISTGYFGNRYVDILNRYGANVTLLEAKLGETVSLNLIEEELKKKDYKLLTITHVDTSTGVITDPKPIAALAKKYDVLSVLDGVCSVAGEEIQQENWGLDVVFTASQKAIGVPPGLALLVASKNAIATWENRKTPVPNYYADWKNWLPIMKSYQNRKPSYFATPPVNLIVALEVSLKNISKEGIKNRTKRHVSVANAFRKSMETLGLTILPKNNAIAANTLTAVYYPENCEGGSFLKEVSNGGIILAGGLLSEIKSTYFRVGHMGAVNSNDVLATIGAIEIALQKQNHTFKTGSGLKTFLETYTINS